MFGPISTVKISAHFNPEIILQFYSIKKLIQRNNEWENKFYFNNLNHLQLVEKSNKKNLKSRSQECKYVKIISYERTAQSSYFTIKRKLFPVTLHETM